MFTEQFKEVVRKQWTKKKVGFQQPTFEDPCSKIMEISKVRSNTTNSTTAMPSCLNESRSATYCWLHNVLLMRHP